MQRVLYLFITTFFFFGVSINGFAQQSDSENATASATILAHLDVQKVTDLSFDDVSPGIEKTIPRASGAEFTVTGGSGAAVSLSFTLPSFLDEVGAETNQLPISFTDTDANWETGTTTDDAGTNAFDPTAGATTISSFPAGGIAVFLGGTVQPANTQAAGTYEGTITLTATYN